MEIVENFDNHTYAIRLHRPSSSLTPFKALLSKLAKVKRPESMMINGLWEFPLTHPYPCSWRQAELMSGETLKEIGGKKMMMLPHEEWSQEWSSLIFDMKLLGSPIYRMRILALAPKTEQILHVDVPSNKPVWRFHLPLLTHKKALMEFHSLKGEVAKVHLPADGRAYLVNTALPHRVINHDSTKWRIHFVADLIHWNADLKADQAFTF